MVMVKCAIGDEDSIQQPPIDVTTFRKFIAPQTPTAQRRDQVYHIGRRADQFKRFSTTVMMTGEGLLVERRTAISNWGVRC
jgi:hypothetical protein